MKEPFISIKNLHQSFGDQHVLRGINLDIYRGETLVLLGGSGAGKSVLVKHLPVLLRPTQGEIWVDDVEITKLNERQLGKARHEISMMFQGGALFDSFTVFENVAFPLREEGKLSESKISERVNKALKIVRLEGQGEKFPSDISGGMKKRVALARSVVDHPSCVIYDEPHAGLDPITADAIDHLIKDLQKDHGITNIVITHEIRSVFRIADRIVYMKDGQIYWMGTPIELKETKDPQLYNFVEGISNENDLL
jgi:phospholipid/cholesterol/gamma-HCH transport system ATP-binding protein